MTAETVSYATCPLCEATCGLAITTRGHEILKVRGDDEDVFSKGFICPKGGSLKALHEDPDRVRTPLKRRPDGGFDPISWDEAFAEIDERLQPILAEHGRDAAGVYLGNPSAHNFSALVYGRGFLKALGTKNIFSASTVDQMPKQVSAGLMFGGGLSVPVPDLDNNDFLMILGANPLASNGSLLTAPDMRGRLRAIRARGGRIVVVDPRRSRTAEESDEHVFIRPGMDALLMAAMAQVIFSEGLADAGAVAEHVAGMDEARAAVEEFTPEAVADACRGRRRRPSAASPASSPKPQGRRLRPDRHLHPGVRDARQLARGRAERHRRQPRREGRRDVPARRSRAVEQRR